MEQQKIYLTESEMPRRWYNVVADIKHLLSPPLDPADCTPISPEKLLPIFPMPLIEQEASTERWIDIPQAVIDALIVYRPSPLIRARRLEQYLETPARIYFKNESVSPVGSHKPNTAIPQAYFNKISEIGRAHV